VNRTPATSTGTASKESGAFVSYDLYKYLRDNTKGSTAWGEVLTPGDDQPKVAPVAVMSYRHWRERYGSDPSVIGAVFNLDDKPFTIVGIAASGCFGDSLRNASPAPTTGPSSRSRRCTSPPAERESQACANDTNAGLQILMMLAYFMAHEEDPINSLLFMVRELNTIRPTCVILLVSFGSIV
jgi:hypothetical protein